jgi:hypothetical protein
VEIKLKDNGGRRSGTDLRQFSYTNHIPERRSEDERRSSPDRRYGLERRTYEERRSGMDSKNEHKDGIKVIQMRSDTDRRSGTDRRASFG